MKSEIERRIGVALECRRTQSEFVDQLLSTWTGLIQDLDDLAGLMERAARGTGQVPGAGRRVPGLTNLLDEWLSPSGDGAPLTVLRGRAEEVSRQIEAMSARLHRDTVNLGVVGVTRSGKSTMLRAISGLDERVVPSSQYNPTTAAPSRIYHQPGGFRAVLDLHDWHSFRDSYLARLHHSAKLGPPPATLEEFARRNYGNAQSEISEEPYLRKLQIAQRTLPSYEADLRRGGTREVRLDELHHFVAYPNDVARDPNQPYHGVRSVAIECPFPQRDTVRLGLVDLPGEGEVGLEVDELFLSRMRTEVDLLLLLKRPSEKDPFFTNQDESALRSVAVARGGVELHDAVFLVVNPDLVAAQPGHLANTLAKIDDRIRTWGIQRVCCDAASAADVESQIVVPVLEHLAERLVEMDRAGIGNVLKAARSLARDVAVLGQRLGSGGADLKSELPDEERRLWRLARELRNRAGRQILDLRMEYDRRVASGEPDPELAAAIEKATATARREIADGFGQGREEWVARMHDALGVHPSAAREAAYNEARARIADIYDEVDGSLRRSVENLWSELATVLNANLGDTLVPDPAHGADSLESLRTAGQGKAALLQEAVRDILELRIEYGSLVLRVTRPILRGISEDPPPRRSTSSAGMALAGAAADVAVMAAGSPVPITPFIELASSGNWWERRPTAPSASAASEPPIGAAEAVPAQPDGSPSIPSQVYTPTTPPREAQSVLDALCKAVSTCIDELDAALVAEARDMPKCLAAAIDRFWDHAFVSDMSDHELRALCDPLRTSIWPGEFDGAEAQLAASLAEIVERASGVQRRAAEVAALQEALRLG